MLVQTLICVCICICVLSRKSYATSPPSSPSPSSLVVASLSFPIKSALHNQTRPFRLSFYTRSDSSLFLSISHRLVVSRSPLFFLSEVSCKGKREREREKGLFVSTNSDSDSSSFIFSLHQKDPTRITTEISLTLHLLVQLPLLQSRRCFCHHHGRSLRHHRRRIALFSFGSVLGWCLRLSRRQSAVDERLS